MFSETEAQAIRDAQHWRFVAAYLASCHAATLESFPKSGSKSERRRLTKICNKAALYLLGKDAPPRFTGYETAIQSDIERCQKAAEKYGMEDSTK